MRGLISFVMDKISFDLGLLGAPPKPRCNVSFAGMFFYVKINVILVKPTDDKSRETMESPKERLLTSSPAFLGHLADEMLAFETRLDDLCYHPSALRPVDLFTHRIDVLQQWLCLESEAGHARLNELLAKPYAWTMDNK